MSKSQDGNSESSGGSFKPLARWFESLTGNSESLGGRSESLSGWFESLHGWFESLPSNSESLSGWFESLPRWSESLAGNSKSRGGRSESLFYYTLTMKNPNYLNENWGFCFVYFGNYPTRLMIFPGMMMTLLGVLPSSCLIVLSSSMTIC